MTSIVTQTVQELVHQARAIARTLSRQDSVPCIGVSLDSVSCLAKEGLRPLTAQEQKQGWAQRPFWAYDTERLCLACRSYYYADQAAQTLERLGVLLRQEEASSAQSLSPQGEP